MDEAYGKLIAERIQALCGKRGISINKLATMSGIRQSTLNNIVNGQYKNQKLRTLHKIALAFSMTPAELLDFKELNEYSFDDDEDEDE